MPKLELKLPSQTANEKAAEQAKLHVANLTKKVEDLRSTLETTTDEYATTISKTIDEYDKEVASMTERLKRKSRLIDELKIKERRCAEETANLIIRCDGLERDHVDATDVIKAFVKKEMMWKEKPTREKKADVVNACT